MTDQTPTPQQPAGWYPDPEVSGSQRFWDGQQWTDQRAPITAQTPPKKGGAKKIVIPIVACLGLAVVLLVVGAALGGDDEDDPVVADAPAVEPTDRRESADPGEPTAPAEEPESDRAQFEGQDLYQVGETAHTGGLDVTVDQAVDPWTSPHDWDTPPDGQRYVAIEVTLHNPGDQPNTFSPFFSEIIDSEGRTWDAAFTASGESTIDGEVPPSATRKGWMHFGVGEGAEGLVLRIRGNLTATGSVIALSQPLTGEGFPFAYIDWLEDFRL